MSETQTNTVSGQDMNDLLDLLVEKKIADSFFSVCFEKRNE